MTRKREAGRERDHEQRDREKEQITDWLALLFDSIIKVQFCMDESRTSHMHTHTHRHEELKYAST